jgi:hypothetical protein
MNGMQSYLTARRRGVQDGRIVERRTHQELLTHQWRPLRGPARDAVRKDRLI